MKNTEEFFPTWRLPQKRTQIHVGRGNSPSFAGLPFQGDTFFRKFKETLKHFQMILFSSVTPHL
jgi:hypothetical protein